MRAYIFLNRQYHHIDTILAMSRGVMPRLFWLRFNQNGLNCCKSQKSVTLFQLQRCTQCLVYDWRNELLLQSYQERFATAHQSGGLFLKTNLPERTVRNGTQAFLAVSPWTVLLIQIQSQSKAFAESIYFAAARCSRIPRSGRYPSSHAKSQYMRSKSSEGDFMRLHPSSLFSLVQYVL